jgi:biopolymer transport protein ExbD
MTPMIDILLVLIIVFMVVVSMSQQKGLDAQVLLRATSCPSWFSRGSPSN